MSDPAPYWLRVSQTFSDNAEEYDGWFAGNKVFAAELAALTAIRTELGQPRLELGVGPGHFAAALDISFGVDPALAALERAKKRSIQGCRAIGEQLPFLDQTFSAAYLLFTDCFLKQPSEVFSECRRVLKESGHLIIGMIPAASPWGRLLAEKGAEGHSMYRHARFRTVEAIQEMLLDSGFEVIETTSALLQPPEASAQLAEETPVHGFINTAGFVVLVARPAE